ncbi:MAG TPA: VWA domain-containing protein [Vicinamibacterales bacterium]|jgi:Ca-activated chloride channel family protein|nr:VWA domain-containing protein [Vicinamibacterales bacterium]
MTRHKLPVSIVALALSAATALSAQQRIRSGVELVELNVTVTDPAGKYTPGLAEEDFEVYEDGAKQKLTLFSATQQPISLAILLDTSASMEERMGIAQEAAIGFTRQLHKDDQAEVIDFDSQVRVLSPFTGDGASLEKAIKATTANGSTSLYNAVYIALKDLKKVKAANTAEIRRQAIVLLSDGDDTSSLIEFDQVLDLAKRSETVIYCIGLRQGEIARREFKEAEFVLKQLSNETGGRAYFPTDARDLAKIYQSIWDELSTQYTMAYSSGNPKRDGAWRRVQVRLTKQGLVARTKLGYYGPTGS